MSTIRIVFAAPGQRVGVLELPWTSGKPLKLYLKEPAARRAGLMSLHLNAGYFITNQRNEKIRLTSTPRSGDEVLFVKRTK